MRITTPAPAFALAVLLIAGCGGDSQSADDAGDKVLNVYNWADYIAPDTLRSFEAEYGIKVNYDVYDSSEIVDVKMLAGSTGYDVVFHSNAYATTLAPVGVFQKLDKSRLKNLGNLDPAIMKIMDSFAVVKDYNVPYHWGNTGYAWNYDLVHARLPDHPMDSLDVILDPEVLAKVADCGVSLLDSASDMISVTLLYLGRDPTAVDDESLALAEAHLRKIRPYIRYFSNTKLIVDMPSKETCVAMSWSGDYAQAAARASDAGVEIDLRYTVPKEGSRLWTDAMYIPTDAKHVDNAYLFIDFILRPDIAADIANEVKYANANRASWDFVEPWMLEDPAIFPDEEALKSMFVVYPAEPKRERARTRAYSRAKSGI